MGCFFLRLHKVNISACRLHHRHNKARERNHCGRFGGASAKKSARRQAAPQLSRNKSRQQLTYNLRYQNRRRLARAKARTFIRRPRSGLQAPTQGAAEQGDLYGDTVGCLCLSLNKGQPQTTDQLPSRVQMLHCVLLFLQVHTTLLLLIFHQSS